MSQTEKQQAKEHYFITYLETLTEDRAALAALRRGLGQPPGSVPDMHRYIIPLLQNIYANSWEEEVYYLVASLFALHPESVKEGNLGTHFAQTLDPNPDYNKAIERRFTALLTAHPQDLPFYLRQAISFLQSKEQAINWHQLMRDILRWEHPTYATTVQKRWAAQFWRKQKQEEA